MSQTSNQGLSEVELDPRQRPNSGIAGLRPPQLVIAALCVFVAVALFFVFREQSPERASEIAEAIRKQKESEQPAKVAATGPTALTLLRERKQLDETIWREEVEAQHYETYFVELWDKLRAARDQIKVLEKVAFESLQMGQPQPVREAEWGILISECSGAEQKMDNAQYVAILQGLAEDGLRIIQTEWHHSRFEVSEPEQARSTVSIRIDALNERTQMRYNVTGDIFVEWETQTDAAAMPRPKSIDASGVRITQRSGPVGFEVARKIDSSEIGVPVTVPSVIVYDLNGDGLSELLIPAANLMYRNRGDWQFDRLPLLSYPSKDEVTASVAGDFNGDGRVDLLLASAGIPKLHLADEQGNYTTPGMEVDSIREPLMYPSVITAGDVDADGDLDVWLAQYKPAYHFGQMPTPYYDANDGFPSYLLLNDGAGVFQDATEQAGLAGKRNRRTYSGSLVDLDEDGDLDLAVASDYSGLDLYFNDGAGHFQDETNTLGELRHCFGMSLTFADYNLDSHMDLYMTGMASTTARRLEKLGLGREEFPEHQKMRTLMGYGNRMFLAKPHGFSQATFNDQVARTGWSWGSSSFDFDNDADPDIYVANGHRSHETAKDYCTRFWTHDIYTGSSQHDPELVNFFQQVFTTEFLPISWNGFEHNCLLMNESGNGFLKIGFLMGVAFEFDSRNVISDDFDGDGRVDLLVVGKAASETQGAVYLVKNTWESDNHWIGVHLLQPGQGRSPLGARVTIDYQDGRQVKSIVTGDSLYSQHAATAHFGLGKADSVDRIEVLWPDGTRTTLDDPAVDRYHPVRE